MSGYSNIHSGTDDLSHGSGSVNQDRKFRISSDVRNSFTPFPGVTAQCFQMNSSITSYYAIPVLLTLILLSNNLGQQSLSKLPQQTRIMCMKRRSSIKRLSIPLQPIQLAIKPILNLIRSNMHQKRTMT